MNRKSFVIREIVPIDSHFACNVFLPHNLKRLDATDVSGGQQLFNKNVNL